MFAYSYLYLSSSAVLTSVPISSHVSKWTHITTARFSVSAMPKPSAAAALARGRPGEEYLYDITYYQKRRQPEHQQ
eukprot:scaffold9289_cov119-Skeletonema_dohrnii-CCMP3373.AAC.3